MALRELALFAGAGGGILAGRLLGWRCVCAVELDDYARRVLLARQDDGSLEPFPVWDDIRSFDSVPWRGLVDVVSGGFPCADISVAGRGAGIGGEHSGLWAHMARVVCDVRPRYVFVENSPALTSRGLGRVLGDLAALGFNAEWGVLGASDVGANHYRNRIWIVAHAAVSGRGERWPESAWRQGRSSAVVGGATAAHAQEQHGPIDGCQATEPGRLGEIADPGRLSERNESKPVGGRIGATEPGHDGGSRNSGDPDRQGLAVGEGERRYDGSECASVVGTDGRTIEPGIRRAHDGLARIMDSHRWGDWRTWEESPTVDRMQDRAARLRCLGNGQVPQCAAEAFRQLEQRMR